MRKKRIFYSEIAYVLGVVFVALGVAFCGKADLGFSMIVAPAYILHRWISPVWPFFSFGMAEYTFQALLVLLLALALRRFRLSYLLSFVTAVIYGFVLDGLLALLSFLPADEIWLRAIWFVLGVLITAAGVSMMFHTYLSPQVYELVVKEVSAYFHADINKVKIGYDASSLVLSVILSFIAFGFGRFVGVSWGTVVITLVNGLIISRFSRLYEKHLHFRDAFPWRKFFTGEDPVK